MVIGGSPRRYVLRSESVPLCTRGEGGGVKISENFTYVLYGWHNFVRPHECFRELRRHTQGNKCDELEA